MKSGTESTVKFKKLKRSLGLPEWQVIGLLESLWQLTARSSPQGDIGRFSNEDIAASIEWAGDEDELIQSLVDCGWLQEDSEFRLVVHDWSDHAPTYIRGNLKRHNKEFANDVAKQRAKQSKEEATKQPAKEGATKPSQAKPSQAKPSEGGREYSPSEPVPPAPDPSRSDEWCEWWAKWKDFWESKHGMRMPPSTAEVFQKDLFTRGHDKGIADIKFSILKSAKSILDSSVDFGSRNQDVAGSVTFDDIDFGIE